MGLALPEGEHCTHEPPRQWQLSLIGLDAAFVKVLRVDQYLRGRQLHATLNNALGIPADLELTWAQLVSGVVEITNLGVASPCPPKLGRMGGGPPTTAPCLGRTGWAVHARGAHSGLGTCDDTVTRRVALPTLEGGPLEGRISRTHMQVTIRDRSHCCTTTPPRTERVACPEGSTRGLPSIGTPADGRSDDSATAPLPARING